MIRIALAACVALAVTTVAAQDPSEALPAAFEAAAPHIVYGPAQVELLEQADLAVPEGMGFIPKVPAGAIMQALGNGVDPELIGLVVGEGDWLVVVEYTPSGYIRDEEARDWDVDAMLEAYRKGTESQNAERLSRGIPPIEITGWVQEPEYDDEQHLLVWSMASRDKGAPADAAQGVNYNTYALGREGYVTLNLVTALAQVETQKPIARQLLSGVTFREGKRYADFNAKTDRVAEYGIAALVGGIAAKKLGLLAAIGLFLAKTWKLLLVGALALGGIGATLLGRRKGPPA